MSLNPVYLWNPQNFPDPQAMLPGGFDAAHRIVSEWADQPLPQGADTSAFDKLAGYIAEAARSGKASADFKAAYADIETQVAEQLKSRAILELYEHYLELMPILTCRSESLGLVLYDANGYLLLPDGREYPDQETQDEITAYWRQREAEEQKWRQENRGLPKNIKDFYKYFRPKVDELMARHGFEYAPHLFNTVAHKRKKLEPDVIIYAKPMTNGQQTIYINYRDVYKDGEYSNLCLEWYLSDKEVERIYLHDLDNIRPRYGETKKKTIDCRRRGEYRVLPDPNVVPHWPVSQLQNRNRDRGAAGLLGSEAAGSIMDRYLRRCGSLYCRQFGRNRQAASPYRDFLPARSKRPHRRKRRVVADLSDGRQGRGIAGKIGFLSDKQAEGRRLDAGASVAPFHFLNR